MAGVGTAPLLALSDTSTTSPVYFHIVADDGGLKQAAIEADYWADEHGVYFEPTVDAADQQAIDALLGHAFETPTTQLYTPTIALVASDSANFFDADARHYTVIGPCTLRIEQSTAPLPSTDSDGARFVTCVLDDVPSHGGDAEALPVGAEHNNSLELSFDRVADTRRLQPYGLAVFCNAHTLDAALGECAPAFVADAVAAVHMARIEACIDDELIGASRGLARTVAGAARVGRLAGRTRGAAVRGYRAARSSSVRGMMRGGRSFAARGFAAARLRSRSVYRGAAGAAASRPRFLQRGARRPIAPAPARPMLGAHRPLRLPAAVSKPPAATGAHGVPSSHALVTRAQQRGVTLAHTRHYQAPAGAHNHTWNNGSVQHSKATTAADKHASNGGGGGMHKPAPSPSTSHEPAAPSGAGARPKPASPAKTAHAKGSSPAAKNTKHSTTTTTTKTTKTSATTSQPSANTSSNEPPQQQPTQQAPTDVNQTPQSNASGAGAAGGGGGNGGGMPQTAPAVGGGSDNTDQSNVPAVVVVTPGQPAGGGSSQQQQQQQTVVIEDSTTSTQKTPQPISADASRLSSAVSVDDIHEALVGALLVAAHYAHCTVDANAHEEWLGRRAALIAGCIADEHHQEAKSAWEDTIEQMTQCVYEAASV